MTKILDRLPLLPRTSSIAFGSQHVKMYRDEVLIWISIGLRGEDKLERLSPLFPAVLDTGNTYDFYLNEHHLENWAGIRRVLLPELGRRHVNQQVVTCHAADVWIYSNEPGSQKRRQGTPPFRLYVRSGIAVARQQGDKPITPRLPLLGLPALRNNGLDFWFDSQATHCYLRTAGWRSGIIRSLHKL